MSDLVPAQYPALKAELTGDPKVLGLAALSAPLAAAKLNLAGASLESTPDSKVLEAWEVMGAIDTDEWDLLFAGFSESQKSWFNALVSGGKVDASNARVKAGMVAMFPAPTAPKTRAAVGALVNRPISRAEALFGLGAVVGEADVIRARALP